jgi:hypothetical protein
VLLTVRFDSTEMKTNFEVELEGICPRHFAGWVRGSKCVFRFSSPLNFDAELPSRHTGDGRDMTRPKEISTATNNPQLLIILAFVTGNKKKLEEVKHILSQGNLTIPFKSHALDCILLL